MFLCTKFAIVRHADGRREIRGDPEYIKSACAASLARLGIDSIDLYYQHRVDPKVKAARLLLPSVRILLVITFGHDMKIRHQLRKQ